MAVAIGLLAVSGAVRAGQSGDDAGQAVFCGRAIAAAEQNLRIPDAFLAAIGRVESGRPGASASRLPWPWTINAEGHGHFYATRGEAIAATRALQARGVASIDVGCLQVNLAAHPDAFARLDDAFDPAVNVAYGAAFLRKLFGQTGSWPRAAAAYHSQTPALGSAYLQKVLTEWAIPQDQGSDADSLPPAQPPPGAIAAPGRLAAQAMVHASFGHAFGGAASLFALPPRAPPAMQARDLASYRRMPVPLAFIARPPPRAPQG